MKKLILALLLIPQLSLATDLTISPGSTVTINANQSTTVSCTGSSVLPVCILRYSGSVYWLEINNSSITPSFYNKSDVLNELADYKTAGVCL